MVDVVEMLVPAALHFGQEQPPGSGVAGIHICVKVAGQTAGYLGLVENTLNRCTRSKTREIHHHTTIDHLKKKKKLNSHSSEHPHMAFPFN